MSERTISGRELCGDSIACHYTVKPISCA